MSFFRDTMHDKTPCSVSKELVEYVANKSPNYLLDKAGQPIIPAVLFILGFYIDFDKIDNEYYVVEDKIIRCANKPYMTYRTTFYNGTVRNEIEGWEVNKEGKTVPVYTPYTAHYMKTIYEQQEVLTIDTVSPEFWENINNIGQIEPYNKGMLDSEKRVDPNKSFRQIVR